MMFEIAGYGISQYIYLNSKTYVQKNPFFRTSKYSLI